MQDVCQESKGEEGERGKDKINKIPYQIKHMSESDKSNVTNLN